MTTIDTIPAEERGLAAVAHLSGLAGYVIPLGGVLAPIIIWASKRDSPVISSIAKQALHLNIVVFVLLVILALLWAALFNAAGRLDTMLVALIPLMILAWIALGIAAIALPLFGAVKASGGTYYRYPVVGIAP